MKLGIAQYGSERHAACSMQHAASRLSNDKILAGQRPQATVPLPLGSVICQLSADEMFPACQAEAAENSRHILRSHIASP